jgi:hypothetical protein
MGMYEPNKIIMYIGYGLGIMGVLYLIGLIKLNDWTILCYSYSAFCFVGSDFFDFKYMQQDELVKKFNDVLHKWERIKRDAFYYLKQAALMLAVFFSLFSHIVNNGQIRQQ